MGRELRGRASAGATDETPVERAKADLERLLSLRSRVGEMERTRLDEQVLRTDPAFASLLPGGGLQPGGVYSVQGATSLIMSLLAGPSADGAWCAVVGMPAFGAEAAARFGVDLDRLVLVPHPGERWFSVTAALADAVSVVVTVPRGRVGDAEASRLAARMRQHGAVLLVAGEWPRTDARVGVASSDWSGLGDGHGYLRDRRITVAVQARSWGTPRRAHLELPPEGGLRGLPPVRLRAGQRRLDEPARHSTEAPRHRIDVPWQGDAKHSIAGDDLADLRRRRAAG